MVSLFFGGKGEFSPRKNWGEDVINHQTSLPYGSPAPCGKVKPNAPKAVEADKGKVGSSDVKLVGINNNATSP